MKTENNHKLKNRSDFYTNPESITPFVIQSGEMRDRLVKSG